MLPGTQPKILVTTLAMPSTLRPSILDASFVPAQGEDLTLWHDAVKATGAAGISTTFGLALTPIQTYNAAKVACVVTDAGLKLSVSPRFWWAIGNTAGGVLLASPGILWDVIGWGCQRTTLRTALKVGLCGFTVTQLRLGEGELAAGGLFLLSHVRTLSKDGCKFGDVWRPTVDTRRGGGLHLGCHAGSQGISRILENGTGPWILEIAARSGPHSGQGIQANLCGGGHWLVGVGTVLLA